MPDDPNPSTGIEMLPLDGDTQAFVTRVSMEAKEAHEVPNLLAARIEADPVGARYRIGLARSVRRNLRRLRALERERQMMIGEYDFLMEPIRRQIEEADQTLFAIAALRRRAALGNFFDVPGVGRWKTSGTAERWKVDNATALGAMHGDDLARFVEQGDPVPPPPKLKGDALREYLSEMLDTAMADCKETTEDGIAAYRESAAARIASLFPGVEYVPSGITATRDKDDVIIGMEGK